MPESQNKTHWEFWGSDSNFEHRYSKAILPESENITIIIIIFLQFVRKLLLTMFSKGRALKLPR